ncbi:MAG: hypothetical protein J6Q83_08155 [Clostridia bacterium]|jgi:hypothetical protein|nr:hypothetical protein [Clostridia bacterium]
MDEIITIQQKKEKKKKAPFIAGIIVLALAIVGVVSIVEKCIGVANTESQVSAEYEEYADFLMWVVGVDPDPFADITKANKETLRNIAVCDLLSDSVKTGEYEVSDKGLIVPAAAVEGHYTAMFGSENPLVHGTVVGYGYQFDYDAAKNVYYVPLSGATPPFAVRIDSVEKSGGVIQLRVGYVGINNVEIKADGSIGSAEPDKYADITLKKTENGYNLISLMTVTVGEHQ